MLKEFELSDKIKEILDKDTYLEKRNDGEYCYEFYADYKDELSEDTIIKILNEKNKDDRYDLFNEILFDMYCFSEVDVLDDYVNLITANLSEDDFDVNHDFIFDYLRDLIYFKYPNEHYLNTKVYANLILDVGDANYDFSVNDLRYMEEDVIPDESAILWLAEQQGYSKEQLKKAIFYNDCDNSNFLKTLRREVFDAHYMNALTFLFETTLKDLMDFEKDNTESLIVGKKTNCGLVDYWYGAGGNIEINLEKDVIIPGKFIDSFTIDGGSGQYSINSIYGPNRSIWNGQFKEIKRKDINKNEAC